MQKLRVEYWQQLREINPKDLVFIDEMGMNLSLCRTHARAPRGKRAYSSNPYKGKNISVIGAIALQVFLGCMTIDGTTNGDVFRVVVEKILGNCLWPGAIVVMDNLGAHKLEDIQLMIEKTGAKVIYLSPYSPDFNPIENCWSKLKQYLRSVAARSRDALESALVAAIDSVTLKDLRNWLAHCCYCIT